eukprot:4495839-Amphidinium_carterae.2
MERSQLRAEEKEEKEDVGDFRTLSRFVALRLAYGIARGSDFAVQRKYEKGHCFDYLLHLTRLV